MPVDYLTEEQIRAFLTEKQATITGAIAPIYELARPADDNYYQEIVARYPAVRRFLCNLLKNSAISCSPHNVKGTGY